MHIVLMLHCLHLPQRPPGELDREYSYLLFTQMEGKKQILIYSKILSYVLLMDGYILCIFCTVIFSSPLSLCNGS